MRKFLLVQPNQSAKRVEIGDKLEDLQRAVGGYIEMVRPFDEPVAIIVNEEGKIAGLPANRAWRDEDETILDIFCGDFLIVGLGDEGDFISLTEEQMQIFEKKYEKAELFLRVGGKIMVIPYEPND